MAWTWLDASRQHDAACLDRQSVGLELPFRRGRGGAVEQHMRRQSRRRQLEVVVLGLGIEEAGENGDIAIRRLGAAKHQRASMRIVPGLGRDDLALLVEPGDVDEARRGFVLAVQELVAAQDGILVPQAREPADEGRSAACRRSRLGERPVEPGDLVVLAIGVVVALLGAAELVAGEQHRRALRQEQAREHGACSTAARLLIAGSSLGPSTPQLAE